MREKYTSSCYTFYALPYYLADLFFEGSNALHVTAHFARPRGILVVAEPLNHRGLHSAHQG